MKYVQSAVSEDVQNMSVIQEGQDVYYETNKSIHKGTELLVWYGKSYEMFMGIPLAIRKECTKQSTTTIDSKYH